MQIVVSNAPTKWGQVAYRIESHIKEGYIEAEITPPTREMPKEIVIRLRHPEGKLMRTVTVDGKEHKDFDASKDIVRLMPSSVKKIIVRVSY
jgi:hypothetical protein